MPINPILIAKIVGPILLIIGLIVAFNAYKKSVFNAGYDAAEQDFRKIVEDNDRKNREKEAKLQASLDNAVEKLGRKTIIREIETQTIVNRINENIADIECEVPASVVEDRNKIRALIVDK